MILPRHQKDKKYSCPAEQFDGSHSHQSSSHKKAQNSNLASAMCISSGSRTDSRVSHGNQVRSKRSLKQKIHEHLIVEHHYHDHAWDDDESISTGTTCGFGEAGANANNTSFPVKLYEMLSSVEQDGFAPIVSWQPHGRCFVVHEPGAPFKSILPHYFKLSKLASFQRQLNLYGFTRLTTGLDKGGYYSELFLRGKPGLMSKIQRIKVKGTGVRAKSNPTQEPNFWNMPWAVPLSPDSVPMNHDFHTVSSVVSFEEEQSLADEIHEKNHVAPEVPFEYQDSQEDEYWPDDPREGSLVFKWGKPFHYLSELTLSTDTSSVGLDTSGTEDMDITLDDAGLDNFMEFVVSAEDATRSYLALPGWFCEA
jgi:hypothetical protein